MAVIDPQPKGTEFTRRLRTGHHSQRSAQAHQAAVDDVDRRAKATDEHGAFDKKRTACVPGSLGGKGHGPLQIGAVRDTDDAIDATVGGSELAIFLVHAPVIETQPLGGGDGIKACDRLASTIGAEPARSTTLVETEAQGPVRRGFGHRGRWQQTDEKQKGGQKGKESHGGQSMSRMEKKMPATGVAGISETSTNRHRPWRAIPWIGRSEPADQNFTVAPRV